MLKHYMGDHWKDEYVEVLSHMIEQPGAFVREVALQARMLAAHDRLTEINVDMLQSSIDSLLYQMRADKDFLMQRRPMGLGNNRNNRPPFGTFTRKS